MKTKTIIEELSQEDLVNLFSTATYGSSWLGIRTGEKTGVQEDANDCLEDVWAKAVLAGHKLKVTDYYAEGDVYGPHGKVIKKDGTAVYFIGLKEIMDGLQKCADGTFIHTNYDESDNGDNEKSWIAECFQHFKEDTGEMDNPEAEALMQVIMFNELIYG